MKIKIEVIRKDFVEVLNNAIKVINTKSSLEVLKAVKISAANDKITVQATDLTVSISQSIDCTMDNSGEFVMPFKAIDLIRKLEDDYLTLDVDTEKNSFNIISGKIKTFFAGLNTADFPEIKAPAEGLSSIKISGPVLRDGLSKVSYAVSKDSSRPIFTGVLFDITKEGINFVATDTFRLSLAKANMPSEKEIGLIVPSAVVRLIPMIQDCKEVTMSYSDSMLLLETEDAQITTTLIPGSYPQYSRLFPEEKVVVSLNTKEFKAALDRAALFMGDGKQYISMDLKMSNLFITAGEGTTSNYTESLPVEIKSGSEDDLQTVYINAKYCIEILSANIGCEYTELNFSGHLAPVVIKPVIEDKNGEEKELYSAALVVPIRVAESEKKNAA